MNEFSEEPKGFWGKFALITAFLSTVVGIVTIIIQFSEMPSSNSSGPQVANPPLVLVNNCCDTGGSRRCPLVSPLAMGSSCFCPEQGDGISCP